MKNYELLAELNALLDVKNIRDYAPNGLQVEGKAEIRKVLTAVSASKSAIEEAIKTKADALLVHHGYFWKGENPELIGIKKERIKLLLSHDINLFAYHLPLDLHPTLGNNAAIARDLSAHCGLENVAQSPEEKLLFFGDIAQNSPALAADALAEKLHLIFRRKPQYVGSLNCKKEQKIRRIAWCSGAAQDFLSEAVKLGADAFISGEYAERTYHEAFEYGIFYFSCGHHATERGGVQALSTYLREQYCLESSFYDQENPF
ncbi:MAG: Nif3-like dinuclear metal center hexameric protein [Cardiobacteriaceae bacterium]|nr:Nif3-like dinuclear metal center hexameric protein [Cardiobacteriaceae bacterium]